MDFFTEMHIFTRMMNFCAVWLEKKNDSNTEKPWQQFWKTESRLDCKFFWQGDVSFSYFIRKAPWLPEHNSVILGLLSMDTRLSWGNRTRGRCFPAPSAGVSEGGLSLCSCPCELGICTWWISCFWKYNHLAHSITAMPSSSHSVCDSVPIKTDGCRTWDWLLTRQGVQQDYSVMTKGGKLRKENRTLSDLKTFYRSCRMFHQTLWRSHLQGGCNMEGRS